MTTNAIPMRSLLNGRMKLPVLGFGGAPLGGLLRANDNAAAAEMMARTWGHGYTYYDTAPFYGFGRSERAVGDALRGKNYILSTKVGRLLRPGMHTDPGAMGWPDPLPFTPEYDYGYDAIMRSYEDSLQRLGLDRIDILFVHDIGEFTHTAEDNANHLKVLRDGGYRALDELRRSGAIRAIGLGVNETAVCREALKFGDWDMFLLAGRYTLLEQMALDDLLPECLATETSVVIGGPYNSGALVGGDTWNYSSIPTEVADKLQQLRACARRHDVSLPAAALQFPLAHKAVVSVIPGLRDSNELTQTLQWTSEKISAAFWRDLRELGLLHETAPTPENNPYKDA
ncbi:D-threo-aldose 1-dehydrogenase [Ruegeria halocynthiae]|uniref:D-threo-aldose 1-dehydrogenase n=1 Tax=Ruegeria halocynthiae TaxID=985054 RepID=A0A1H3BEP4_9RHOB|nr:aldo/keto reductase [Ruegeria halocynthiae]SDX40131.1 D-threo-aldose 1-dehydrogenase [Ruegeria halocynthiae]